MESYMKNIIRNDAFVMFFILLAIVAILVIRPQG